MKARDRVVAAATVVVVLGLSAAVIGLVRDAETSGVATRESIRTEQTRQLAGSMETRVQSAYASLAGVHGVPGRGR